MESNDTLYGHDKKFLAEVEKLCSVVIEEIFTYLKGLADGFEVSGQLPLGVVTHSISAAL